MDKTNHKNRAWQLSNRPHGKIKSTDLELVETPIPEPASNEVLARTIYFSLDPTNRIWMSDMEQYMEPVKIGDVMRAAGSIAVVEVSNAEGVNVGDVIQGGLYGGWQEYFLMPGEKVIKIPVNMGLPLPAFLSVLGFTGLTAYFCLLDVGKPKSGETVVVSAAAGAVGSIVCQIAKIKGCHVVGIAGSDEKCDWLRNDLGVDSAINYKSEDVLAALKKYCSNGIDIYFENVGGEILDAALTLMNKFGRIPLCGLISMYNDWSVPEPKMLKNILMKRLTVQGFILLDYLHRMEESLQALSQWIAEGKIQYRVDIVDGIENAPTALSKLFTGENQGKLLIQTSKVES